jgi:hypothetical protein
MIWELKCTLLHVMVQEVIHTIPNLRLALSQTNAIQGAYVLTTEHIYTFPSSFAYDGSANGFGRVTH